MATDWITQFREKLLASASVIQRTEALARVFEIEYAHQLELIKRALAGTPATITEQVNQVNFPGSDGQIRSIKLPMLTVRFVNRHLQVTGSIQVSVEGAVCSMYVSASRPLTSLPLGFCLFEMNDDLRTYKWAIPTKHPETKGTNKEFNEQTLAQVLEEALLR